MKVKNLIIISVLVFLTAGCRGPLSPAESSDTRPGVHKAVVNEVIQAGQYTYLSVSEKRKKIWLAIPAMQVSKGEKISFSDGLEMKDFHSKELNRTFASVIFLQGISSESKNLENNAMMSNPHTSQVKPEKINISLEPGKGCIIIAKLFETKSEYSGKVARVRGKTVKINQAIMGRNWIHLQDGSEFKDAYDLTVTTDAKLTVGDTVTLEGKIALDRDFGYGYFYEVIMEDGKLVN